MFDTIYTYMYNICVYIIYIYVYNYMNGLTQSMQLLDSESGACFQVQLCVLQLCVFQSYSYVSFSLTVMCLSVLQLCVFQSYSYVSFTLVCYAAVCRMSFRQGVTVLSHVFTSVAMFCVPTHTVYK